MAHFLYILYSEKVDKYYTGESAMPSARVALHNHHHFRNAFTNIADDWSLVLEFECLSREEALYLERFIKRMKSKKFTKKVVEKPSILTDILSKK